MSNLKQNPKKTYLVFLKDGGSLTKDDSEKAEVLNNYFSSVFTQEDINNIPIFKSQCDNIIEDLNISSNDMVKALKSLKINKSPGPDSIHPRLLKELAVEISIPLTFIFNKSIKDGSIPSKRKIAEVRPIFKKAIKQTQVIIDL